MNALDLRVEAALGAINEDCRWELIAGIVDDCPDDVLATSLQLLAHCDARSRTLGADVLGRLVGIDPGARPAARAAIEQALEREPESAARASMVAALGHIGDTEPLGRLIGLAEDVDPAVRLAVAFAIATIAPQPLSREARYALIKLSGDAEPEVRDWATFGLGTLSADDGPDVRAALLARAQDTSRQTRAEALFGLAVRRDPRAVPHLIQALESPAVGLLELDAAAEAADPRLLPALWALQRAGLADAMKLRKAINRCSSSDKPVYVQ